MKQMDYRFLRAGISLFAIISLIGCQENPRKLTEDRQSLRQQNVVWNSPSKDPNGSMPVGNGDIGLNAWVDESGRICFYIGKTDSWDEYGRLVKVGKVSVTCDPALIFQGSAFKQELDLLTGTILISTNGILGGKATDLSFRLWVDANNPVIQLTYESSVPLKMQASAELWRTKNQESQDPVFFSDLMQDPSDLSATRKPVINQPDSVIHGLKDKVIWLHHNKKTDAFDFVVKHQGMAGFYSEDPLFKRTFGALLTGSGSSRINATSIETKADRKGHLSVYVLTSHPAETEGWIREIETLATQMEKTGQTERRLAHEKWWSEFWDRSWIYASADSTQGHPETDASIVSRAYTLQRFINACGGRGAFPIKFNGSIFTVPPADTTISKNPDYRRWGPGYWWQNTRLPYMGMCASGDLEMMKPLFKLYGEDIYKISKQRTKKNFGIDGVYFPECMNFWGTNFPADYGPLPWNKREDKLQDSRWHKWEWVAGPELVFMMLDYYDYTGDQGFLKSRIIPVANDVIRFFDNYYKTNGSGKLVMHPSQAAETWWNCTNPMPELAGLHSIVRRLLAFPDSLTGVQSRQFWKEFGDKLPPLPLRDTPSGKALAPAEKFDQKSNVENPELYAVFPFRLYGLGNPDLEYAQNALEHRWDKGNFGWRQDDLFMAYLGLTDQAKEYLVGRAENYDSQSRFPAFWGPNYDWVPDQDHGGILVKTFQSMLMQTDPYSKKIYLLPAWPKDWNVNFKLHAPYNTILEGTVKNGKLESLKVSPESREQDVINCFQN